MRPLSLISALAISASAATAQTPGFWLVGMPEGAIGSGVSSLSQDGQFAAGGSTLLPNSAPGFVWNRVSGRSDFGLEPGMPPHTPPLAMNSDGSVLAGWASGGSFGPQRAYRRVGNGPLENLGLLSGRVRSTATGISGDGNTVVGYSDSGLSSNGGEAFRWTPSGGMQGLGFLIPNGGGQSAALGISRDGSTIVGTSRQGGPGNPTLAFVWTEATGMQGLPSLQNALFPDRYAHAVNTDGAVIVGMAHTATGRLDAVRWTAMGVQDLGVLPSFQNSAAYSVNDDGTVIGGNCGSGTPIDSLAFIWTPATGMLSLTDYLWNFGIVVPTTFQPEYVQAISGDGLTFGGYGLNTLTGFREGFVATVPAPETLAIFLAPLLARRRRRARS